MIVDWLDFHWIYILHSNPQSPYRGKYDFPETEEECLEHWGKWAIFGPREYLDELACQLDPYVEDRYIHSIKYLCQAPTWLGYDQPAMCVYCDDREREEIWQTLSSLGVTHKQWVYESETIASCQPGGEFVEKMIAHRRLSPEESDRVRERFQQYSKKWLSHIFGEGEKDPNIWNFEQMMRKLTRERSKREK